MLHQTLDSTLLAFTKIQVGAGLKAYALHLMRDRELLTDEDSLLHRRSVFTLVENISLVNACRS